MTHDPDLNRLANAVDDSNRRLHAAARHAERCADVAQAAATAHLHGHDPDPAGLALIALATGPATTTEIADAIRAVTGTASFCGIYRALRGLRTAGTVDSIQDPEGGRVLWSRRTRRLA
jgi:hypothetical protein